MKTWSVFYLNVFLMLGCSSEKMTNIKSNTPRSEHYNLDDSKKGVLMECGEKGDGDAAYRLYLHYIIYANDEVEAMKWLYTAVKNGNAQAKNAMKLIEEKEIDE